DGSALLRDVFGFHELAVEDAEHFGQRPKLEEYDDFALLVVYGVDGATPSTGDAKFPVRDGPSPSTNPGTRLVEVHCFCSSKCLVTVHRGPTPVLIELAATLARRGSGVADPGRFLHRVVDGLVDSFFPALAQFDDDIDQLEDEILQAPTQEQLARLFQLKRSLISMRKVAGPERDVFAALAGGASVVPGVSDEAQRYFRDIYDHLIRVSDLIDSYRDLLSGAMDTHLSTVSNRLNGVMKQLTIIASIFLPLSFLTGFFGQNFGWMVTRLSSLTVFLVLGVGLQVVTLVVLLTVFKRRGWLGSGA
ncbi:MAG: magnesium transporter CorA family protein, partial [Acidimicrobiales bacterium]